MDILLGTLNARLLPNGTVETSFTLEQGDLLRPLLAKNLDTAEWDWTHTYGLTADEAAVFRSQVERFGFANTPAAL